MSVIDDRALVIVGRLGAEKSVLSAMDFYVTASLSEMHSISMLEAMAAAHGKERQDADLLAIYHEAIALRTRRKPTVWRLRKKP